MRGVMFWCHFTGTTHTLLVYKGQWRVELLPARERFFGFPWAESYFFCLCEKPPPPQQPIRPYVKPFKYVNLFNPHSHTMWKVLLLSPFYGWENWGREKLFAELTQPIMVESILKFRPSGCWVSPEITTPYCFIEHTEHKMRISRYRLSIMSKDLGWGFDIYDSPVLLSSILTKASI